MAAFDIESTGVDVETARVVTAAVLVRGPGGLSRDGKWLLNPNVEIPAEATAVHGITTEAARNGGLPAETGLAQISEALEGLMSGGTPLVIYNAPYDLTLLDRETRRYGLPPFIGVMDRTAPFIIDPLVLDKALDPYRRGKRTLTAACEHYQVPLDDAHNAGADAIAAMRVAWRIATRYPEIASMGRRELHDLQVQAKAEQAASFQDYLRRQGKDDVISSWWPLAPVPAGVA